MSNHHDIVTITMNPTVDKSTQVGRVMPEKKLRCEEPRFEPGGGGINVARAISRLGGRAAAFYPEGGYAGKLLEHLLHEEGIPYQTVAIRGTTRVNLIVNEKDAGQQYRFGMPGPNIKTKEWRDLLGLLSSLNPFPSYLVVSGSLPPGVPGTFYRELAALAAQHQSRLLVDSSHRGLAQALKVGVFMIKPNLRELQQLAGQDQIGEDTEMVAAARSVIEAGQSEHVVLSLGRCGAVLVSRNACVWVRAPHVHVRSKVGAGDSMVAGITLTLARGGSELEAAAFGVAAGTAAVLMPGSELCRREDAERLKERIKIEEETV